MKMWDFSNQEFVVAFSMTIAGIVLLISVLSLIFIFKISFNSYARRLKEESNFARIYSIDPKNNTVMYFVRSNLKNKLTTDLANFYSKFHPNDVEKVKSWIFSICVDPKNAEQYLEADVLLHKGHAPHFSLLKLIKYDQKNGIIHLESHVLRYITPNNYVGKNKKGIATGVVKRSVISGMVNKGKSIKGFIFTIRFFYLKQSVLSNDRVEKYMTMTLRNEVYPFATNAKIPRQILETSETELSLFDLRLENKENAIRLANSISKAIKKSIKVNGFLESVDFAIGIASIAQYYQDFDALFQASQQACITAQHNDVNIYLSQRSGAQKIESNRYQTDVEHLFEKGALRFLFRPIIKTKNQKIIGYFQYVKAYDSPFTNMVEMSRFATRVGENKKLFSLVSKTVIPKFANECSDKSACLFYQVSMFDLSYLYEIISQIPSCKDIRLVLTFDEQEVSENTSKLDLFAVEMERLKSEGFEIALLLNDRNLLLDPSVYNYFDYFVAGANTLGEIKKNSRVRLSIHVLIEGLLKYKKPIIATDLEGWQAIELIIKSGITLLSSEVISPSNDMLLPIERKKKEKISVMSDKYQ